MSEVKQSDGMIAGFGEIIKCLYKFAQSVELRLFDLEFTLWDLFLAGLVVGLLAVLWHGLTE